ncbi:MAG TPA: hypothetical protein VEB21_11720 [Terriglobales bacterium]|nr:hypothetical protein [Terriglobales bacterium]
MGTLLGFVVGYFAGTKVGPEGLDHLRQAWKTIIESDEFKALIALGSSTLQRAMQDGGVSFAKQLSELAARDAEIKSMLGRISKDGDLLQAWNSLSESQELRALIAEAMAGLERTINGTRPTAPSS